MKTRTWLRLEGAVAFAFFVYIFLLAGSLDYFFSWWGWVLIFFAPDLSFAFYAFGNKIGALGYNVLHSYIIPFLGLGICIHIDNSLTANVFPFMFIWIAHIGFDRMLGYGLKEVTGFKDTHLGRL